jgi:phosphoribosyl 1,2-cyclic phosphate phosphodiesterase
MKVILLGTGSSSGVPMIGCNCNICQSKNPKNKRKRSSIYIEANGVKILVDTSPDLRQQVLEYGVDKVDAVIFTHAHADHIHGIDELRSFNYLSNKSIPIYANQETLAYLKDKFDYCFLPVSDKGWYRPSLVGNQIDSNKRFDINGLVVHPFLQNHGVTDVLGIRIGDVAYSVDVNFLPESSIEIIKGTKVWIVDCLRYTPSHSHAHLDLTLQWVKEVNPDRAILTHMSHNFDYDQLKRELPTKIQPGFDGMVINI